MKYIFAIVLFLSGYDNLQQKPKRWEDDLPPAAHYYLSPDNNDYRYAFFKFDKKRDRQFFNASYKPSNLSNTELKAIEKVITEKVEKYNRETKGESIKQPSKYYKQFVTVINSNGEKEVWVNCSCQVVLEYWKKRIVFVDDGGACYFQVKINLTTNKVTRFSVNGIA